MGKAVSVLALNSPSGDDEVGRRQVGLPYPELCSEIWQRVAPLAEDVARSGKSALLENQLFCVYRNGYAEETYLSLRCDPVVDNDTTAGGITIIAEETTHRVISARRAAAVRDIAAAGKGRSVEDACYDALEALSRHPTDIPFALLYAQTGTRMRARLIATAGLPRGTPASPDVLAVDSAAEAGSWPVATAIESNRMLVVDDLLTRFEPLPPGGWPLAPRSAVIVPLVTRELDRPDGALILGVSARRELDTQYLDFIELIAKHVGAAITAGRLREEAARDAFTRATAKVAQTEKRARTQALKARVAGVLEERSRLAREIHDTLLQDVTGIALQLRAALPRVQASPDDALTALERVADLAENTSREARQVVWDMRPSALDEDQFVRAVEITARRAVAGSAVALDFKTGRRTRTLDHEAQRLVLRIVQEAITNAVRHAAAKTIRLNLSFGARQLRLVVADDGRGFTVEPDFRSYAGHWGLVGMQERAEQIGASLRVQSVPQRGTTVTLALPLPASRAGRPAVVRAGRQSLPAIA